MCTGSFLSQQVIWSSPSQARVMTVHIIILELFNIIHSIKFSLSKGPCKRTQHCWPTIPNIVGPNNVVTCCVRLHGTTTMLALVAYSLKPVKLLGPCKRTQQVLTTPSNVGSVCTGLKILLHGSFENKKYGHSLSDFDLITIVLRLVSYLQNSGRGSKLF